MDRSVSKYDLSLTSAPPLVFTCPIPKHEIEFDRRTRHKLPIIYLNLSRIGANTTTRSTDSRRATDRPGMTETLGTTPRPRTRCRSWNWQKANKKPKCGLKRCAWPEWVRRYDHKSSRCVRTSRAFCTNIMSNIRQIRPHHKLESTAFQTRGNDTRH